MPNSRSFLTAAAVLAAFTLLVLPGGVARAASPVLRSAFVSYRFDSQAIPPVRAADLDQDGVSEVVSGARAPGNHFSIIVSKLVSNHWQRVQAISVGTNPPAFVLSDLNHDGKPDLVYVVVGQPFARINDGAGTFGPEQPIAGNGEPADDLGQTLLLFKRPGTGDEFFARDGSGGFVIFRDSVETNGTHDYIQVARVDDGGLVESFLDNSPLYGLPPFAAEADLNGDGALDVAAFTDAQDPNTHGPVVRLFMNVGNGNYAAPVDVALDPELNYDYTRPEYLYAADVDGDGDIDLVVDREDTEMSVLTNDGAGHFTATTTPQADLGPTNDATVHGAPVDVNGDGHADFLIDIVDHLNLALVLDLHGNILHQLPTGIYPFGLDIADFDHDGAPDIVVLNEASPVSLNVFLGRGGSQFGDVVQNLALPESPMDVAVGDLDSDGTPDLALVSLNDITTVRSTHPGVATPYALPANGTAVAVGVGVGSQPSAVEVVTTLATQQPARFPASSTGVLGLPSLFGGTTNEELAVATGDLNGDGRYDIAAAILEGGRDSVIVWLSNGSGFQPPVRYAVTSYVRGIVIADMNGDGAPDILTASDAGSVSVLLNTGSGAMAAATDYSIPDELEPASLAVASLVGPDNYPDVALAIPDNNEVFVFQGDGHGALTPLGTFPVDAQPVMVRAGDIDADGNMDLVTANLAGNTVSVLAGTLSGSLHSLADAVNYGACQAPKAIALGNFTNHADGSLDVVAIGNRSIPSFAPPMAGARPQHAEATTETDLFYLASVPHVTTSVRTTTSAPSAIEFAVAPNPARGATDLVFAMPQAGHATVDVFDLAGRRVARLANGNFPAGLNRVHWEGQDDSGGRAAVGVYLARVSAKVGAVTRRVVLVR